MKINRITVFSRETALELTLLMQEFVDAGWHPHGGVACSCAVSVAGDIYTTYCQTMVLFEEEK